MSVLARVTARVAVALRALRGAAVSREEVPLHGVLEAVIEGTTDDVFVKDVDGRFIVLNARAAQTIGRPREELIGRLLHEVLPQEVADMMVETDRLVIERGTVETFEEIVQVHGETRVLLTTKGPYRGRDGALLGTFGIARDITARKAQEEELVRSNERFQIAQGGARMGIWDLDLVTGATAWSDGLRRVYGVGPNFPTGFQGFGRLLHPDDQGRVVGEFNAAHASGADFEFECRIIRPDGVLRWILIRSTVVPGEHGAPVRRLGVAVDITERKLAEEDLLRAEVDHGQLEVRLRQAEKLEALGQLAGGVAHDFNNLLLAIRGYGELALGRLERGEPGAADDLAGVLESADRAGVLTRQLLAFGRRQVLTPETLDLNEVVRSTVGLLEQLVGDTVEIRALTAGHPLVVKADRGQLEQVLTNLALNARDAMPDGGALTIQVAEGDLARSDGLSPGHAVLSVTDEGSGIDAATAALIFEPFFSTKGEEGTGLGLATVYGIVAQSGGHLVLDTAPGEGSTFTVYLPLSNEALSARREATPALMVTGNETILLVEDDPAVREIVSMMLTNRGYAIISAPGGEEAISLFESRDTPIELVISDLIMRGLDGRETTDRIRMIEPATRVLFMSGNIYDATIRGGELETGTGFIQKPFTGEALATQVRKLLDHVAV